MPSHAIPQLTSRQSVRIAPPRTLTSLLGRPTLGRPTKQRRAAVGRIPVSDVFIAYSRRDAAFVRQLAGALEGAGKEVWVDLADIPAGSRWRDDVARGIETSHGVVFVVSPDSL